MCFSISFRHHSSSRGRYYFLFTFQRNLDSVPSSGPYSSSRLVCSASGTSAGNCNTMVSSNKKWRCDYNISNDSYSLAFIRLIIQLVSLSQKTNNIWLLGLAKLSSSSQRDTRRSMICQLLGPFLTNSMHAPSPCHWLLYLSWCLECGHGKGTVTPGGNSIGLKASGSLLVS